ncbi:MAG TPA: DUF6152 family protein [Thiobacillus sp.]|nr:DUF6152 family protein [Thiobacillus sp.]
MNRLNALLFGALLTASAAAHAHHGWMSYDASQTLTLIGKVVASGYEHPHGYVKLATQDKTWTVVLAPPSRMERRGLPREAIAVGATVTVVGYPHRDTTDELRAERITAAGNTVELR